MNPNLWIDHDRELDRWIITTWLFPALNTHSCTCTGIQSPIPVSMIVFKTKWLDRSFLHIEITPFLTHRLLVVRAQLLGGLEILSILKHVGSEAGTLGHVELNFRVPENTLPLRSLLA